MYIHTHTYTQPYVHPPSAGQPLRPRRPRQDGPSWVGGGVVECVCRLLEWPPAGLRLFCLVTGAMCLMCSCCVYFKAVIYASAVNALIKCMLVIYASATHQTTYIYVYVYTLELRNELCGRDMPSALCSFCVRTIVRTSLAHGASAISTGNHRRTYQQYIV